MTDANTIYASIETRYLKAALTVVAGEDDLRTYLRCLYISPQGCLEASNGHIAHRAKLTWHDDSLARFAAEYTRGYLISTQFLTAGNLAKSRHIGFDFTAKLAIPERATKGALPIPQQCIGARYPDLDRIIPAADREGELTGRIAFKANYLAPTEKALGVFGCQLLLDGPNSSIRVHWGGIDPADFVTVLMPMRF